jgi:hypothetical protein
MNPTVELVLASTCKFPYSSTEGEYASNIYTFRITYPKKSAWRKLAGLTPKPRTVYGTGHSPFQVMCNADLYSSSAYTEILTLVNKHFTAAEETFTAIHSNGRITHDLMKRVARLWGPRLNEVLKIRKIGEVHAPVHDRALTDHVREATPNGWRKSTQQ